MLAYSVKLKPSTCIDLSYPLDEVYFGASHAILFQSLVLPDKFKFGWPICPGAPVAKFNGINITIGSRFLRASPAHGTAGNIINPKNIHNTSFKKCINFFSL